MGNHEKNKSKNSLDIMLTAENLDNRIKEFWPKNGPPNQEINKYIKKYSKEKIVIKCGGRVLLDPVLFDNFIKDVVILKKLGLTPLLIHGGGLGIKKKLDESNIKSNFIMGLSMWVQQKLNPTPPDPIQAKIFMFFPIFLTIILAPFPSGLVVYWTINNVLTIAQQWIIMRGTKVKTV